MSDPATSSITWEIRAGEPGDSDEPLRPTNLMEKVSRYVELCSMAPANQKQIEENVAGKRQYVRNALEFLVAEGHIAEAPGERNARLFTSVTPYREADDRAA